MGKPRKSGRGGQASHIKAGSGAGRSGVECAVCSMVLWRTGLTGLKAEQARLNKETASLNSRLNEQSRMLSSKRLLAQVWLPAPGAPTANSSVCYASTCDRSLEARPALSLYTSAKGQHRQVISKGYQYKEMDGSDSPPQR